MIDTLRVIGYTNTRRIRAVGLDIIHNESYDILWNTCDKDARYTTYRTWNEILRSTNTWWEWYWYLLGHSIQKGYDGY